MHFAVLPPEVNSGRMYAGSGAGSMLAAAAAWDELANELHTTAANLESVSSGLTSEPWQGPSAASMAAAAEPQLEWLNTTAAQTTQSSNQANAAVAAYESAYAMTVPPPVVAANRAELTSLIATNLLGQNTAAIAATEVAYGEMWAQDVAAMYSYAGESQAASAGNAQTALSSGDVMSAVPNALQTLTSSSSGLSAFSNPYDLASLGSGFLGNALGVIGLSGAAGFITDAEHRVAGPETVSAQARDRGRAAPPASRLPDRATTVSAGLGRASSLGGVSVPEGWASAAPEVRLVAQASPITSPVPTNGSSPGLFSGMPVFGGAPLMSLSGRGAADFRARRPGGKSDAPGVDLREVTDLLSKLGRLRDNGVLTDKEFGEQKQRLLGDPSR
jgi:PPE-repeat protein